MSASVGWSGLGDQEKSQARVTNVVRVARVGKVTQWVKVAKVTKVTIR